MLHHGMAYMMHIIMVHWQDIQYTWWTRIVTWFVNIDSEFSLLPLSELSWQNCVGHIRPVTTYMQTLFKYVFSNIEHDEQI